MKELWKLVDFLEDDIKEIAEFVSRNQRNGALERAYVRAIFADLEGILYLFRKEMIRSYEFDSIFSKKERAFILEKIYDVKNDVVKNERKFHSLSESIKGTMLYFARHRKIASYNFPDNSGWQDMLNSISIRNSITHPKKLSDLDISMSKIECIMKAKKWFRNELVGQFL